MTAPVAVHIPAPAGVPPVPQAQTVPEQQFAVPPMGNGVPIAMRGQVEGMVPQNQGQQAQPQQQAAPAVMDMASIQALINNALGTTPQPVPQAQPQVTPAPTKPAWVPDDVAKFDVSTIQDPTIKAMATVLQHTGKDLDLNRVIGRALSAGDVSLIDYAYLQEKGGENAQQLAEISKGIVQAVSAKADAVTATVYGVVGGEAQWNQSTAIFNQVAPYELRATVAQMLDSPNEQFILAGAKIVAQFAQQSGRVTQQGVPLLNGASAGNFGGPLSKEQFQQELRNLKQDTPDYEAAREQLYGRRALGKQQGL